MIAISLVVSICFFVAGVLDFFPVHSGAYIIGSTILFGAATIAEKIKKE